jgi:hypothetical protein
MMRSVSAGVSRAPAKRRRARCLKTSPLYQNPTKLTWEELLPSGTIRIVKNDVTRKVVFLRSARGLLKELTGDIVVAWLNVELPRVNKPRMDLLGRLGRGGLVNIEFQACAPAWPAVRTAADCRPSTPQLQFVPGRELLPFSL